MKIALNSLNTVILAGLLAAASAGAFAEGPTATSPAARSSAAGPQGGYPMMGRHDPAKMQAQMAKRQADMKATLKITPAQEGAWTAFTAAMQPPARMARGQQPMADQRAELEKLTTPERIDKMKAIRAQRMIDMNAEMDKRGEATKAFYAALSLEQQKTFDAEHRKMGGQRGDGGYGSHGGPGHHRSMGDSKS